MENKGKGITVFKHKWLTDYFKDKYKGVILKHLSNEKGLRFLSIGSNVFINDDFYKLTVSNNWHGVCVDGNPLTSEKFLMLTKSVMDKITFVFSYVVPPRFATTQKLLIDEKHHGDATLIQARRKEFDDVMNIWVKCMSTTELVDIIGTDFKALNIDTEGLDVKILKALPNQLFKNLNHVLVETVDETLVSYLHNFGLKYKYYVEDTKFGQYFYFTRQPISQKLINEYKEEHKLRNNSLH